MSNFSPTDAALEGVWLARKRPKAILIWSAYYFAFTIILLLLGYLTLGPHAQEILSEVKDSSDPAETARLFRQALPFFALSMPLGLVFFSMLIAGIFRAVMATDEPKLGLLRFGPAEWRLAVLVLIALAILGVATFVITLAYSIAVSSDNQLIVFAVLVGTVCLTAYLFVRLSLAGPATFSEGRLVVFRSWPRTHGQFWPLLGAYVMAGALWLVMLFLMTIGSSLVFGVIAWTTGWSITGLVEAASSPPVFLVAVAWQAVSSLIQTTSYVILLAPSAEAYKHLVETEGAA